MRAGSVVGFVAAALSVVLVMLAYDGVLADTSAEEKGTEVLRLGPAQLGHQHSLHIQHEAPHVAHQHGPGPQRARHLQHAAGHRRTAPIAPHGIAAELFRTQRKTALAEGVPSIFRLAEGDQLISARSAARTTQST
ncbi:hypothetical protein MRX96_030596 [Rhipicephalus microplus]